MEIGQRKMKFPEKRLNFDTFMRHLTLTPDLDLGMLDIKLKLCIRYICIPSMKCLDGKRTKNDEVF